MLSSLAAPLPPTARLPGPPASKAPPRAPRSAAPHSSASYASASRSPSQPSSPSTDMSEAAKCRDEDAPFGGTGSGGALRAASGGLRCCTAGSRVPGSGVAYDALVARGRSKGASTGGSASSAAAARALLKELPLSCPAMPPRARCAALPPPTPLSFGPCEARERDESGAGGGRPALPPRTGNSALEPLPPPIRLAESGGAAASPKTSTSAPRSESTTRASPLPSRLRACEAPSTTPPPPKP